MRFSELPKDQYEGYELVFSYDTKAYFDVRVRSSDNVFAIEMVKQPCALTHKEFTDKLFAPHWDDPHAYGLWDGNDLLAVLEVSPEEWNNRLRITSICVREGYRRRGIGTLLMTRAKEIARTQKRRALVLETQSCNVGAIKFYRTQGFELIGFDSCAYSNQDIEKHEFRIEMGYLLNS